jgi:hypothetical protein
VIRRGRPLVGSPDWGSIMQLRTLVLSIAVVALVVACGGRTPPGTVTRSLSPELVFSDNAGGIQDSMRVVIRDSGTLRDLWQQATATHEQPPAVPQVDFRREMLLLVGAGRMTIEDQIRVESAVVRSGRDAEGRPDEVLEVAVLVLQGCGRLQRDGFPVEIVRVHRFDGPVTFTARREQDPNC